MIKFMSMREVVEELKSPHSLVTTCGVLPELYRSPTKSRIAKDGDLTCLSEILRDELKFAKFVGRLRNSTIC